MKPNKRIVFGIDPGTRVTGYGVISVGVKLQVLDFGCIRPPPSQPLTERYRIIFQAVEQLLEKYKPDALSIETQYIHKNPQSGLKLGMARGVAVLAASLREIPIFEYAPSLAKKAIVGNGKASKLQVQMMVQKLLALSEIPEPEDAADALALAICHSHRSQTDREIENRI